MLKRAMASLSRLHSTHSPPQPLIRRWVLASAAAFYSSSSSSSSVPAKIAPSLLYTEDWSIPSPLSLYSLKDPKIRTLNPPKPSICIGAGHGWLVLADYASSVLTLFNPTTNQTLPLPKLSTFDNVTPVFDSDDDLVEYILKIKSSSLTFPMPPIMLPSMFISRALVIPNTNNSSEFIVFLVLQSPLLGLAYAKPGDIEWTAVEYSDNFMFLDVIRHKNEIYTVMGREGRVCAWEFGSSFPTRPKMTLCIEDDEREANYRSQKTLEKLMVRDLSFFLVTSPSGDLLRVRKERIGDDGRVSVKIHKVESGKLVEVKSLGENAMLLGSNSAVCISAVDVPELKSNHVYFAESCMCRPQCDVGIYSMEDGSTKPFSLSIPVYPRPAWVMI